MSVTEVPTSSAVMYRPPRLSMNRPCARKIGSLCVVFGSPMMTDLPPPRFSPATDALYVIPRDRRRASMIASSSLA